MKFISKSLSLIGLMAGSLLISCSNENPWEYSPDADGKISLEILTDGSILNNTRAEDAVSPLVPGASEFSISLKSTDGTYSKSWNSLSSFNNEEGFPMGHYIISAYYGDVNQEGFSHPYFYGEAPVSVVLGQETPVSIEAVLANSMVSVRYSDQLKGYFTGYSATVKSESGQPQVFVRNENRPVYITPGTVTLDVTLTRDGNQTVTVRPATFKANPRTHVIATIGVEGNIESNQASLTVEFEENVENEKVPITLSDELYTAPKPEVRAIGFNPENTLETIESVENKELNPEFHVFAFEGIKSAFLNVSTSGGNSPAFGSKVDLMDISKKASIEASGLVYSGFTGNTGEMAVINFKNFLKNLKPGEYDIYLDVTDSLGRTVEGETIHLKVKVTAVSIEIKEIVSPKFLSNKLTVTITTNSELVKDQVKFQAKDENGGIVDVNSTFISVIASNAVDGYDYTYTLDIDKINDSEWTVKAKLNEDNYDQKNVDVIMPDFKIETDPFAKRVKIRISTEDEELLDYIVRKGSVILYDNAGNHSNVSAANITRYIEDNIILVSGLNPKTTYNQYCIFLGKTYNKYKGTYIPEFTTEEETDVPNGDFESLTQTITNITINQGGPWSDWDNWIQQQTTETYNVYEPNGWATVNKKTCYLGAKTLNTWFVVPSTYNTASAFNGNNAMVIRSVGFNYNGSVPSRDTHTDRHPYSDKTPGDKSAHNAAGKLFLGSYTIDNTNFSETYNQGCLFNARPMALTGYFKYKHSENDINDKGIVTVSLEKDNKVLASGSIELSNSTDWQKFTIPLENGYKEFLEKPNLLKIFISSSKGFSEYQTEEDVNIMVRPHTEYEQKYIGSVLTIDNLKFEY